LSIHLGGVAMQVLRPDRPGRVGFARVDVIPLPDDPRRPRAILHRLDPPQTSVSSVEPDQLGVGLADAEGDYVIELSASRTIYYNSTA
jgi:hypothetical protein